MDFDLPIAPHPSPLATPLSPPTPRRSHLKQLSLAPTRSLATSPSSHSPSFPSSISPRPRSSTDGTSNTTPTPTSNSSTPPLSQPTSPSPLSRSGSIGRNPQRRQSSISYSPNRASSFQFGAQQQHIGGSPLGLGLGRPAGRSSLEGRRSMSENERSSLDEDGRRSSNELPPPSLASTTFSPATRNGQPPSSSSLERDPSDSLTLVEKHSDLLSYIAQKESKSLELREALAQNDSELASLKKKWSSIVSRSASGRPSPSSTNSNLPTGSIPTSSAASLIGGVEGGGGLLSPEALQSGKRFLTSLLGVGGEEDVSGEAAGSSTSPAKRSNGAGAGSGGSTPRQGPPRTSLDLLGSVVRSGLDMVSESREEPSPPKATSSLPPRPLALSSSSARSKRLSLMSSTSSSSSTSSTAPSSLDLVSASSSNPRGSSSQGGSFDSTTSSSSTSSSLFSLTPTDERSAWGADSTTKEANGRNGLDEQDHRLAGIGEDEEQQPRTRDPRSLMEDMASSSGSSLSGGGWGKRWGDLATSLTGNEHFQSSKRATLGLASTLQSTLVTLSSPPPTSVSHPLSSPSSHRSMIPSASSLFASPALPSPPLSNPRSHNKPNHSRHPSTTKMAPWDASHDHDRDAGAVGGLQEPLVPVGRSPSPRIGPPSPQRKKTSTGGSSESGGGDDGWNW